MDILQAMESRVLLYDGSKGVMLQRAGLASESSELWNATHPEAVRRVYQSYREAGSDLLQTNTFQGNRAALARHGLEGRLRELNAAGVKLAKEVCGDIPVSASIGSTGRSMPPMGDMTFAEAYSLYAEQIAVLRDAGADLLHFETFTDLAELRVAVLAARETTSLPIVATLSFDPSGRTMSGNPAEVCAVVLRDAGADVVGANCSAGPDSLLTPIRRMAEAVDCPLCVKANAGLPQMTEGKLTYSLSPEEFAAYTEEYVRLGVRLIGGCCGTGPEHIAALGRALSGIETPPLKKKGGEYIASPRRLGDVSKLSREAVAVLPAAGLGDIDAVLDEARDLMEDEPECILLDLTGSALEAEELAAGFALYIPAPLLLKGEGEAVSAFKRYYPGKTREINEG